MHNLLLAHWSCQDTRTQICISIPKIIQSNDFKNSKDICEKISFCPTLVQDYNFCRQSRPGPNSGLCQHRAPLTLLCRHRAPLTRRESTWPSRPPAGGAPRTWSGRSGRRAAAHPIILRAHLGVSAAVTIPWTAKGSPAEEMEAPAFKGSFRVSPRLTRGPGSRPDSGHWQIKFSPPSLAALCKIQPGRRLGLTSR